MKLHSTKIFRDMVNGVGSFIQFQFMNPPGGPAAQSSMSGFISLSQLLTLLCHFCSFISSNKVIHCTVLVLFIFQDDSV